jgi:hypothetical protein
LQNCSALVGVTRRLKAAKDPRVKRAERAWRAEQRRKRSKLDEFGIDWDCIHDRAEQASTTMID